MILGRFYVTEDEEILFDQGMDKFVKDQSYKFSEDEKNAFQDGRARGAIKLALFSITPGENPAHDTPVLDAQEPYVKNRIRRHERALRAALVHSIADFEAELALCLPCKGLISSEVVLQCLDELREEWVNRAMEGYEPGELSVKEQAAELGLVMVNPKRGRCQYAGVVVGLDHRAALLKFATGKAIELPLDEVSSDQRLPRYGDLVRMNFKNGVVVVSMQEQVRSRKSLE